MAAHLEPRRPRGDIQQRLQCLQTVTCKRQAGAAGSMSTEAATGTGHWARKHAGHTAAALEYRSSTHGSMHPPSLPTAVAHHFAG